MKKTLILMAALVLGCLQGVVEAQEPAVRDITLEISTNFLTAYRDASWVPVDVVIRNTQKDVSGHLAVRLSSAGRTQAPVYRVSVDSPRGSTKRFRAYCFFDATTQLSATLYDGRRQATPTYDLQLPGPIMEEDFLHLVLDVNPDEGYAFLHRAVDLQGEHVRAVRESLRPEELEALPEFPQCYEPYDAIMIGNLDASRISLPHRERILRFVQRGGTLIINTGANAPKLRGTWLEEASGAAFATDITVKETDLAAEVFGSEGGEGARPGWECVLTELRPAAPDTQTFGETRVLATRRPLGEGQIITLAVDVDSKALQGCPAYIEFWSKLCTRKTMVTEPFFREAAWEFTNEIPQSAGIRVHPRSSVVKYLLVYFAVAIVGNWTVWSLLKRREMAWVCLIFFSIGFTLYAMIVGTAGRAKANALREVQVLYAPPNGGPARVESVTGLLTMRTLRFAMDVEQENMLVADLGAIQAGPYGRGPYYNPSPQTGSSGSRPFEVTQGNPGRIDDFVVGASAVRSFVGESYLQLPGGFSGELTLDSDGLHGTLKNETGLQLESPCLLMDGALIPLSKNVSGAFDVEISQNALSQKATHTEVVRVFPGVPGMSDRGVSNPYTGGPTSVIAALLTGTQSQYYGYMPGQETGGNVPWLLGPCICGWAAENVEPSVRSEREFQKRSVNRFVLAEIAVRRLHEPSARWVGLSASAQYNQVLFTQPQNISFGGPQPACVFLPRGVPISAIERLEVNVFSGDMGGTTMCVLKPVDESALNVELLSSDRGDYMGQRMIKNVYAITGWQQDVAKSMKDNMGSFDSRYGYPLYFNLVLERNVKPGMSTQEERRIAAQANREMQNNHRAVFVSGRAKIKSLDKQGGESIPWQ